MASTTDTLIYDKRLGLGELGALAKEERAYVKEWLLINFCDEETFGCELTELPDGGLSLEDPEESVGGESEFGVHLLAGPGGNGRFLAVLFEPMNEGAIFDREKQTVAGLIIEGRAADVKPGYEATVKALFSAVPNLAT